MCKAVSVVGVSHLPSWLVTLCREQPVQRTQKLRAQKESWMFSYCLLQ